MRKFIFGFCLLQILATGFYFTTHKAHGAILGAPYPPEVDSRFNSLEQGNAIKQGVYPLGSQDGHWVQQQLQATYDYSAHTAVSPGAIGTYDLGVSLPAGAVITQSGIWSLVKPTTSASGTLAFYCQNLYNILNPTAAASFGTAGHAIAGTQNNTITNWSTVTAACNIQAKVATGALTAGKVTLFINYMVHQ